MLNLARAADLLCDPTLNAPLRDYTYAATTRDLITTHVDPACPFAASAAKLVRVSDARPDVFAGVSALAGCPVCGTSQAVGLVSSVVDQVLAIDDATQDLVTEAENDTDARSLVRLRGHLDPSWSLRGWSATDELVELFERELPGHLAPEAAPADADGAADPSPGDDVDLERWSRDVLSWVDAWTVATAAANPKLADPGPGRTGRRVRVVVNCGLLMHPSRDLGLHRRSPLAVHYDSAENPFVVFAVDSAEAKEILEESARPPRIRSRGASVIRHAYDPWAAKLGPSVHDLVENTSAWRLALEMMASAGCSPKTNVTRLLTAARAALEEPPNDERPPTGAA